MAHSHVHAAARRRPDNSDPLCRSCDRPPLFTRRAGEWSAYKAVNKNARRGGPHARARTEAAESLSSHSGQVGILPSEYLNILMVYYEHFTELGIFLGKENGARNFLDPRPLSVTSLEFLSFCAFSCRRKGNFEIISKMCLVISAFKFACHAGNRIVGRRGRRSGRDPGESEVTWTVISVGRVPAGGAASACPPLRLLGCCLRMGRRDTPWRLPALRGRC